jgi:hypothetical protein
MGAFAEDAEHEKAGNRPPEKADHGDKSFPERTDVGLGQPERNDRARDSDDSSEPLGETKAESVGRIRAEMAMEISDVGSGDAVEAAGERGLRRSKEVAVGASEAAPLTEPAQAATLPATLRELMAIPTYLILISAVAVFSLAAWMLTTWLPLFMYENFGMNLAQSGFFGKLAITGPILLGSLLGGSLSDSLGRDKPRNRMILMLCFYGLAIPWPLFFRAAHSAAGVLVSASLFQLCRAFGESNCFPIMYELVAPQKRSTAAGISNCLNTIFAGAGALVVGYFKGSIGFPAIFGMVPILIVVAVAGLLLSSMLYLNKDLRHAAGVRSDTYSDTGQNQIRLGNS